MAQEAQTRVQTAIRDFVNDVDKSHLRGMEKEMHQCAAECCSNQIASINEVIACKERCEGGSFDEFYYCPHICKHVVRKICQMKIVWFFYIPMT